ncbi:ede08be1-3848-4638-b975-adf9c3f7496c [Thermothielavioides terrestris]|uniref:GPI mannosyltransferase 1 n=1 Tax=Thermothielavioides terrestris TaxID=2587410 RepID=A0A446BV22_9PEZI|nr:ede08be1-3848-4638-b975-adf9c3f7496c [Thermothielavioides terrestris]
MAKPSATRESAASSAPSPATPSLVASFFHHPLRLYLSAALLRVAFLLYGLWQDANSPVKYTDIDYLVFTDAARFVSRGQSPYERETYRYTPILAWLLLPTALKTGHPLLDTALFSSGKVLFAAADLVAGWLLERVLAKSKSMDAATARKYAAIWLLNPMVATISTRGSSEGLLGVLVMALLSAVMARRITLAGLLLGFGVHFKIYPFIYAPAIVWWMDQERMGSPSGGDKPRPSKEKPSWVTQLAAFITPKRLQLAAISLATFLSLNILMFFIPYNTQLYLASAAVTPAAADAAAAAAAPAPTTLHPLLRSLRVESVAFLPQLALSCALIPLALAKKDLPAAMLAQTFAFVTFNKVCTSQYFLWYMVLLPLYLPRSSFLRDKRLGLAALVLWVASQALWLQQGYQLEFLGRSAFLPGLWLASLGS